MRQAISRILLLIYTLIFIIGYVIIFGHPGEVAPCTAQYSTSTCSQTAAPVFSVVDPPQGWLDLCDRQPSMCKEQDTTGITFSDKQSLQKVNDYVNSQIEGEADTEQYGFPDYWAIPTHGKGDCEDYVLLKRQLLIDAGWPISDLLITEVHADWFPENQNHAVLTVLTANGDLVLDNLTPHILKWSETGYHYIKRQSEQNPNIWLSLNQT